MLSPSGKNASSSPTSVRSLDWWVRDKNGQLAVAQRPNAALAVWLVTVVLGWTGVLDATRSATVAGIGRGALIVWALDELVRGASPFRRVLGTVILVLQLVGLFT